MNVKVERVIPASPEVVFRAWTDAEQLKKWLGGKKIIANAVVDGLFYWGHVNDGRDWPHYGRFLAVERNAHIELTWMSPSTHGLESVVNVTLTPKDGATHIVIEHTGLPDDDDGRGHERGWTMLLSRMIETTK